MKINLDSSFDRSLQLLLLQPETEQDQRLLAEMHERRLLFGFGKHPGTMKFLHGEVELITARPAPSPPDPASHSLDDA